MATHYVVPLEENEYIKLAEIKAKSERGALQKFCKIYGIKGRIHKFKKLTFEREIGEWKNGKKNKSNDKK